MVYPHIYNQQNIWLQYQKKSKHFKKTSNSRFGHLQIMEKCNLEPNKVSFFYDCYCVIVDIGIYKYMK